MRKHCKYSFTQQVFKRGYSKAVMSTVVHKQFLHVQRKFQCFSLKLNLTINHYPIHKILTFFHTWNE